MRKKAPEVAGSWEKPLNHAETQSQLVPQASNLIRTVSAAMLIILIIQFLNSTDNFLDGLKQTLDKHFKLHHSIDLHNKYEWNDVKTIANDESKATEPNKDELYQIFVSDFCSLKWIYFIIPRVPYLFSIKSNKILKSI